MAAADDSDIPESGAVFTFGKSKFAENLPNKFWVKNDQVMHIACGDEHTALIAESGRIFMFGVNNWGQLGIGPQKIADRPSCIKLLKQEKSQLVACGRSHTIIATESGKVYTFGSNNDGQLGTAGVSDSNVPQQVKKLEPANYKMLGAGVYHSMALTEDGKLFVWGANGEGQLGLGEIDPCPEPQELVVGQRIICISCGYYHSALVTENGKLYTFGESENGKLGLGDSVTEANIPQHVSTIPEKVKSVSCGGSHTMVLTEGGNIYAFGDGSSGQLGLGASRLESSSPCLLKLPFKVSLVSCGENFTALVSEKGQLYTFGDGRHGKLGLGMESFANQFKPSRVERFSKFIVNSVACGGCHMIVTALPKLENGDISSEDEEIKEDKTHLNGTLKVNGSLELTGSFSARDRRRNASPLPLHRTLPVLGGSRGLPVLNATAPVSKREVSPVKIEAAPRKMLRKVKASVPEGQDEDLSEEESDEEKMTPPKIIPRKMSSKHSDEESLEDSKDREENYEEKKPTDDENETEEVEEEVGEDMKKDTDQQIEKDSTEEETEKEEVISNEDKTENDDNKALQADLPVDKDDNKDTGGEKKDEAEDDASESESVEDLTEKPVPHPRSKEEDKEKKGKESEEEEEEEEEDKEKKGKESEEEEEEEDEREEEEIKKKEKEKKSKKEKKEDKKGEQEEDKKGKKKDKKKKDKGKKEKSKEEEEDKSGDGKKEKDAKKEKKGKDKKDKKVTKDKKKGKEDMKEEQEEEEEEDEKEEEEEEEDKGNAKKEKKKKKEDVVNEENNENKDKRKDKNEKDVKKDTKEEDTKKDDEEKKEKTPVTKKRSRLCIIL